MSGFLKKAVCLQYIEGIRGEGAGMRVDVELRIHCHPIESLSYKR